MILEKIQYYWRSFALGTLFSQDTVVPTKYSTAEQAIDVLCSWCQHFVLTSKDPDFRIFKTTSGKIQNELALPEVAAGCGPVQARTDAVICEGV